MGAERLWPFRRCGVALIKKKCINVSMKCVFDDQTKNISSVLDAVWPVGSIYISVDATNPGEKLGGTWEVFAQGQMLLGFSDTHDIGTSGGEETHTLTRSEVPSHYHGFGYRRWARYTTYHPERGGVRPLDTAYAVTSSTTTYSSTTDSTGGGSAHNNMPPYITVGIWRRIA